MAQTPSNVKNPAILAKIAIIRNCLQMIDKATGLDPIALEDQMKQDVFVLNLERASQAAIDLAFIIISDRGLMMPSSYKQSFTILKNAGVLTAETAEKMSKMAGFRNIAIHDYQKLDLAILKSILTRNLKDFEVFCGEVLK